MIPFDPVPSFQPKVPKVFNLPPPGLRLPGARFLHATGEKSFNKKHNNQINRNFKNLRKQLIFVNLSTADWEGRSSV